MSGEGATHGEKGSIGIWLSYIGAMASIAVILGFIITTYNTWYNIPKVTYQILPSYRLPPPLNEESVTIVIIRNEGLAKATGLTISISTSGSIEGLKVDSIEKVNITTPYNTTLIMEMPRLIQGNQASFTLLVSTESDPITQLDVVYDQGNGIKAGSQVNTLNDEYITLAFGLMGAAITFVFIIYRRNADELLTTRNELLSNRNQLLSTRNQLLTTRQKYEKLYGRVIKCSRCGESMQPDHKYCPSCGEPIKIK